MAKFLDDLDVEKVNETTWKLMTDFIYITDLLRYSGRVVVVPAGFETDFASVPRIPFIYDLVGRRGDKAATIHDYLYSNPICDRKTADQIFKEALIVEGVPKYMVWIMYLGVRIFGKSHYGKR